MKITRRRLIKAGGAAAAGLIASPFLGRISSALAAWPEKPVRMIVANTPGGPSDIMARFMAPALQQAIKGSTFIVENVGGGGGNIGMGRVARADPDGYTILLSTSGYAVNPALYASLPYDPLKDFAAIAELATSPNVFAVKPSLGVKTMKELVALVKKDPDKFNIATPPVGTTPHLAAEVLKIREGLPKVATVVHTGGGQALQALLSDAVQISSGVLAPAHPQIKAGSIVGLAVTGSTRWHDLKDIPTMAEAGFPDFVFETYLGLLAPAKTAPEIVALLEKETIAILNRPDMRAKLVEAGFEIQARTGKEHMARVAKEVPMFKDIVGKAGIKLTETK